MFNLAGHITPHPSTSAMDQSTVLIYITNQSHFLRLTDFWHACVGSWNKKFKSTRIYYTVDNFQLPPSYRDDIAMTFDVEYVLLMATYKKNLKTYYISKGTLKFGSICDYVAQKYVYVSSNCLHARSHSSLFLYPKSTQIWSIISYSFCRSTIDVLLYKTHMVSRLNGLNYI